MAARHLLMKSAAFFTASVSDAPRTGCGDDGGEGVAAAAITADLFP